MAAPPSAPDRRRLRRATTAALLAALAAAVAPAGANATSADGAVLVARSSGQYWTRSDELIRTILPAWNDGTGAYTVAGTAPRTRVNSSMLLIHALAARDGYTGVSRDDARAVRLVRRLTSAPAFRSRARSLTQAHTPGWGSSLDDASFQQHVSIDAQVAEALAAAYLAAAPLHLTT